MTKIKDIETALDIFESSAVKEVEATDIGDFKTVNKCYSKIAKSVTFLKENNALDKLEHFLISPSVGVRLWSACYLLPVKETKAIKVLEEIAKCTGIYSLNAETTISEWRKGNLKF